DALQNFEYRISQAVAAIRDQAVSAAAPMFKGKPVSRHEIGDMNVVADTGTDARRIVRSEYGDPVALAKRGLGRDLDEMSGAFGGLSRAAFPVSARDVEISQGRKAHSCRSSGVGKHHLRHPFRPAIRGNGRERMVLADRLITGSAVHSRR